VQCANNLKQMGLAVHEFHDARRAFPPLHLSGTGHATWMVIILPYLEQEELHERANMEIQYYRLPAEVREQQVTTYYCPTRRSPPQLSTSGDTRGTPHLPGALSDYAMNAGDGSVIPWYGCAGCNAFCCGNNSNGISTPTHDWDLPSPHWSGQMTGSAPTNLHYTAWRMQRRIRDVTDGLSNILMIGEKHVHEADRGNAQRGDGAFHNDDKHSTSARVAGPGFPTRVGPWTCWSVTRLWASSAALTPAASASSRLATGACARSSRTPVRSCWDTSPTSATAT